MDICSLNEPSICTSGVIGQGLNNGRFPGNITKNDLIVITFCFLSGFSYITSSLSIEGKQGNHPTIVTVDNYKPYNLLSSVMLIRVKIISRESTC